eukprot:COSAG03_NODE_1127_length_4765_cov_10.861552_9_plen_177_part_00
MLQTIGRAGTQQPAASGRRTDESCTCLRGMARALLPPAISTAHHTTLSWGEVRTRAAGTLLLSLRSERQSSSLSQREIERERVLLNRTVLLNFSAASAWSLGCRHVALPRSPPLSLSSLCLLDVAVVCQKDCALLRQSPRGMQTAISIRGLSVQPVCGRTTESESESESEPEPEPD